MQTVYSYLLQEPSEPFQETVDYLYDLKGTGPVDKAQDIYKDCREKINDIIFSHLPFHLHVEDEELLPTIPEELKFGKIDNILDDYQHYLDGYNMHEMIRNAEDAILKRVEMFVWKCGLRNLPEAMETMMSDIADCAGQYARMQSFVDPSVLNKAYEEAEKVTLIEKVFDNNADDVLAYRQELIEYLEKMCANKMYAFFESFFSILSCSSVLIDVKNRIADVRELLVETQASVQEIPVLDVMEHYMEGQIPVFTDLSFSRPEDTLDAFVGILQK